MQRNGSSTRGIRSPRSDNPVFRWSVVALVASAAACTTVFGDLDRIVAIELVGTRAPRVEEGDTLRLQARARRANGEIVSGAQITWVIIDVDSGQVGFTLDEDGLISAFAPSNARVQARFEELATQAITVTVTAAADSIAAAGSQRLTMDAGAEVSPPLEATVFDLTSTPGTEIPLAGKPVDYQLVDPAPGSPEAMGFFLTTVNGTEPGTDPHTTAVTTASDGRAQAVVRLVTGGTLPDSAIVDAASTTAAGQIVAGSPIRFVVIFP